MAETGETQGSGSDNTTQMLTLLTANKGQYTDQVHIVCMLYQDFSPVMNSLLLLSSGLLFYEEHELSLFLSKAL